MSLTRIVNKVTKNPMKLASSVALGVGLTYLANDVGLVDSVMDLKKWQYEMFGEYGLAVFDFWKNGSGRYVVNTANATAASILSYIALDYNSKN